MRGLLDRASRAAAAHTTWLAPLAVCALMAFSIACGVIGIDFGEHWDEHYHLEGVRECIDGLMLVPHRYIYGSLYFLLGIAVLLAHYRGFLPAFFREMATRQGLDIIDLDHYTAVQRFQVQARALLASHDYLPQTRIVFFCLSALTVLWTYLAVRVLQRGRALGAVAAAAFAALSWELHYHARFVAVDALIAQLTALQLFLLATCWRAQSSRRFYAAYLTASGVAALAFACKATGLALLVPVLLVPLLRTSGPHPWRAAMGQAALAGLVFVMAVLAVQPGTLFDLFRYATTLRREAWEYGLHHSFAANSTTGLLDRTGSMMAWWWLAVPSPYLVGSVLLSAVALLGLVKVASNHPRFALAAGSPVVLMVGMMALHPLLIVRQFLLLVPFQAVGFGVGVSALCFRLRSHPHLRRSVLLILVVVLGLNARWLYKTARTIPGDELPRNQDRLTADLVARQEPIRLSPRLYAALAEHLPGYRCHPPRPGEPDEGQKASLAIRSDERLWHANRFGLTRRTYGARWVNFDWYTPWVARPASPPIFVLSPQGARGQRIHLEENGLCEPIGPGAKRP